MPVPGEFELLPDIGQALRETHTRSDCAILPSKTSIELFDSQDCQILTGYTLLTRRRRQPRWLY